MLNYFDREKERDRRAFRAGRDAPTFVFSDGRVYPAGRPKGYVFFTFFATND